MRKSVKRTYSRYTEEAIRLLANLIRSARIEQKLTTQEVADRAGISRSMLQRIEKADLRCEIGAVFEVATIVGVSLFDTSQSLSTIRKEINRSNEKLSLLPKTVHKAHKAVDDDF